MDNIEFVNFKILSSGEQTECKDETYLIRSYHDSLRYAHAVSLNVAPLI